MNIILSGFSQYLELTGGSESTIKNYVSDIHAFLVWLESLDEAKQIQAIGNDCQVVSSITERVVEEYFLYLVERGISESLKLRTLASLRKFFTFCIDQQWILTNPAKDFTFKDKTNDTFLSNKMPLDHVYESIFTNYEQILEKDGASRATVKNYSSDAQQFMHWFVSTKKA